MYDFETMMAVLADKLGQVRAEEVVEEAEAEDIFALTQVYQDADQDTDPFFFDPQAL